VRIRSGGRRVSFVMGLGQTHQSFPRPPENRPCRLPAGMARPRAEGHCVLANATMSIFAREGAVAAAACTRRSPDRAEGQMPSDGQWPRGNRANSEDRKTTCSEAGPHRNIRGSSRMPRAACSCWWQLLSDERTQNCAREAVEEGNGLVKLCPSPLLSARDESSTTFMRIYGLWESSRTKSCSKSGSTDAESVTLRSFAQVPPVARIGRRGRLFDSHESASYPQLRTCRQGGSTAPADESESGDEFL
jgi:hypothetical protein